MASRPSAPSSQGKDESKFILVSECLLEMPHAVLSNKKMAEDTMTLEIDSDLGASFIVATAKSAFDLPADRPMIIIAWNSSQPLPFMMTPSQDVTYFDLRHGLSSRTMSKLAACLRERFESRGYRFVHFDGILPRGKLTVSKVLRYGKQRLSYRLESAVYHSLISVANSARVMRLRASGVKIGKGTRIGRGTTIRPFVTIGNESYIGELCVLEGLTTVGDGTCINAQCHIPTFSRIGNHVFIAPFFLATNDRRMRYHRKDHGKNLSGVVIEDKVRIAGHVMTMPGVRIGEGAVVGAYSLVTRDVEPYTLVYGIPAEKHMDDHGLLDEDIDPGFMTEERPNP